MSLEWTDKDKFEINHVITSCGNGKACISSNCDGTYFYAYQDESNPAEKHTLKNLKYEDLKTLPYMDETTLLTMKRLNLGD